MRPPLLGRFFNGIIWRSEEKKDDESGGGRKVPTGFERLLRRTRRPFTHENKDKKEAQKDGDNEKKENEKK